jgi:hypothetical protein
MHTKLSLRHSDSSLLRRCAAVAALMLLAGCAVSPEQRAANERALAEQDREWAADCARRGGRYISSSCVGWGGP